jgi:hypothetical protein
MQISNIAAVLKGAFGFLSTSSGNVTANVIPRTGSKATLTTLTSGGGELSSATDIPCIVQLNGVDPVGTTAVYTPMSVGVWNDTTNSLQGIVRAGIPTGTINILGATTSDFNGAGGNIAINSGSNYNSGAGGDININAGGGTLQGGAISFTPGVSLDNVTGANGVLIFSSPNSSPVLYITDASGFGIPGNTTPYLGFFGLAVAQQTPTLAGSAGTTPTAGSGAGAFINTTFNGIGSGNAYTVNQIVAALKQYGLLA